MHNLKQKDDESIGDFHWMTVMLEWKYDSKKERVSFECNKDADFSYTTVRRLIKAA